MGIADREEFEKANRRSRRDRPKINKPVAPQQYSSDFYVDNHISLMIHTKNMTQADLADAIGVKREYVNRIINRKVTPTVALALRIAKTLNTTVDELFVLHHK